MKIYVVSDVKTILCNTGFIASTHTTWENAFEASKIGQYIHCIETQDVQEIISGGKLARRIGGSTD